MMVTAFAILAMFWNPSLSKNTMYVSLDTKCCKCCTSAICVCGGGGGGDGRIVGRAQVHYPELPQAAQLCILVRGAPKLDLYFGAVQILHQSPEGGEGGLANADDC